MAKLRVLVVDDTIVYRKIITNVLENIGIVEELKALPNAIIALEWLTQKQVDVILLDINMPGMNGLEALKIIKEKYPKTEVIMISNQNSQSAKDTIEALGMGALDFIFKPQEGTYDENFKSITKILTVILRQIQLIRATKESPGIDVTLNKWASKDELTIETRKVEKKKSDWSNPNLVLITSSTGGPVALEKILSKLDFIVNKPVLVVQHMPKGFTSSLAKSLDAKTVSQVTEAQEKDLVKKGKVLIAPGDSHMELVRDKNERIISLNKDPYVNGVRPAADVLFKSVAKSCRGEKILVIVLTGMGSDGTNGLLELKESCDCYCITQSKDSCIVYGMPRSVVEAGLSDETLDLNDIPKRIKSLLGSRSE